MKSALLSYSSTMTFLPCRKKRLLTTAIISAILFVFIATLYMASYISLRRKGVMEYYSGDWPPPSIGPILHQFRELTPDAFWPWPRQSITDYRCDKVSPFLSMYSIAARVEIYFTKKHLWPDCFMPAQIPANNKDYWIIASNKSLNRTASTWRK